MYLGDGDGGGATLVDETLPADGDKYREQLDDAQKQCIDVWREIAYLVHANDPLAFQQCNRSFCICHQLRPAVFGR